MLVLLQEDGPVGNLVIFSLPTPEAPGNAQSIFQCCNVRFAAHSSPSPRNLLWRVRNAPTKKFDQIIEAPGYLFINDEEDGFRLSWALDLWNCEEYLCRREVTLPLFFKDSMALSSQETWEEIVCDRYTGERLDAGKDTTTGLRIVSDSESILHCFAIFTG